MLLFYFRGGKKLKKLLAVCPVFDKFCIFVGNYE